MPSINVYGESEPDVRIQWRKNQPVKIIDSIVKVKDARKATYSGFPRKPRILFKVTWHYKKSGKFSF